MTTCYLGAPIARNEDRLLLLGRALFVNDVERPGMLHVAFLRSSHAHARLGAVDLSRVRERAGVVARLCCGRSRRLLEAGSATGAATTHRGSVFRDNRNLSRDRTVR
jgi:CO/xanthine dehydrogenase Mo-binding subunit